MARKQKKDAAPEPAAPATPAPGPLQRLQTILQHPRATWAVPAAAALAAILISLWTFDPKLSLSGDNTEFVTLARSMADGTGLTYTNLPEPRTATKYPFGFPLLLVPVAAMFDGWSGPDSGTPDWVAMKWLVVLTFSAGMAAFALLARQHAGPVGGLAAVALAVSNPLTVSYGHQVMSEVPYLLPSLLALWCLHRGVEQPGWRDNRWLWAGVALAITAYYMRSVGIVLIGAPIALLLLRRDWTRAGLVGGVCFAALLPWSLRNSAAGGGGVYLKQLIQVNPYFPDQGLLDVSGLLGRFVSQVHFYLAQGLTGTVWPTFEPTGSILTLGSVALLALLIGFIAVSIRRQQHLLLVLYGVFFMGTVLLWPWPGDRFILPLVPVVYLAAVIAVAHGIAWLRAKGAGPTAFVLAIVLLGLALQANARGLSSVARASQADYRPEWRNYYHAGLWLRANSPEDAVVTCRKAFWMHVVSGRRTFVYAFKEPAELIADLDAKGATHAIVEQLGYSHTPRFLVPALESQIQRFPALWHRPGPDTYVVGIDPP